VRRLGALLPAALAALLASCASPPSVTSAAVESMATPAPSAAAIAATRVWQITGHHLPRISAMGDADADAWHGRVLRLDVERAANGVDSCETPAYAETTHPAEAFLAAEYRILAAGLGVSATSPVRVLDVTCQGQPWAALGGRILSFGAAEFAVWDGVFFRLRRLPP
jgi:hypothetical protein